MKRKTLFFIGSSLLLLFLLASAPVAAQMNSPIRQDVLVTVTAAKEGTDALHIEVSTTNAGSIPIYIMTRPQRSDRSRGLYIEASTKDSGLILCAAQLYPAPTFNLYFNGTHVHLQLLKPGEKHLEKVDISLPLHTTEPPFAARPGTRQLPESITRVEAVVGILQRSEELDRVLTRKNGHDSITGLERVGNRSLYELQQLVRSGTVEIEKAK